MTISGFYSSFCNSLLRRAGEDRQGKKQGKNFSKLDLYFTIQLFVFIGNEFIILDFSKLIWNLLLKEIRFF
jgi:hypothetical protein